MRFQIEAREPLLDSRLAAYALSLGGDGLINEAAAGCAGKRPLRELFDLYPTVCLRRSAGGAKLRCTSARASRARMSRRGSISPTRRSATPSSRRRGPDSRSTSRPRRKERYISRCFLNVSTSAACHTSPRGRSLKFPAIKLGKEAVANLAEYLAAA